MIEHVPSVGSVTVTPDTPTRERPDPNGFCNPIADTCRPIVMWLTTSFFPNPERGLDQGLIYADEIVGDLPESLILRIG